MNKLSLILIAVLMFITKTATAHQDFWVIKDYGNIKVRVKTGFDYEEINKAFMIGQLSEKLSKELKYVEPIFLDFDHFYIEDCEPDYFLSYDKGDLQYSWRDTKGNLQYSWLDESQKGFLKENSVVVRQFSRKFDFASTLKMLEYAILNLKTIKSTQKQITYNQKYHGWKINSIDTFLIKSHLKTTESETLLKILKNKIERPQENFKYGVSYYWQDNKFNVYCRNPNKQDTILLTVDNIYDYRLVNENSTIIFHSDSTFYHIGRYSKPMTSKMHLIENTFDNYEPFDLKSINGNEISIGIRQMWNKQNLVYLIDKDQLIQNLNEEIDKKE